MPRVLILSLGSSGHHTAARAIEGALRAMEPSVQTLCIDPVSYLHPHISVLIHKTYMGIVKQTPEVWEAVYDNERLERLTRRIRWLVQRGSSASFLAMMRDFDPDVVVCTQAYPFGVVEAYRAKFRPGLPLFGVITDYRPHRFWLNGGSGVYVVPSDEARGRLEALGVARARIRVYGIPVGLDFAAEADRPRRSVGIPRVLVMGGSYGLGITYRMIKRLDSSEANFAIDVVTGLNQRLRRHLVARRKNFVHPVRIRGYVSGIAPLMRTASLLISKPGGATCAEAMIMGLPMIIVRSLPGQEGGNAAELVRHGAAMQLEAAGELPAVVGALVRNRGLLTVMGERARKLGRPDAVRHIARGVLDAARQAPRLQVVSALRRGAEMAAAE